MGGIVVGSWETEIVLLFHLGQHISLLLHFHE